MISNKLKVIRNSGIYTICNILLKCFNFILLPIYTAYLTTGDYGISGLMDSFKAVMYILSILGLNYAVMRFYFDYKDNQNDLKEYISTLFNFMLICSVVLCLPVCIFRTWFTEHVFAGVNFYPYVLVTLCGVVFTSMYQAYQQLLQSMEKAKLSAQLSIAYFITVALFTLIFIVPLNMGATGVLLAPALTSFLFDLCALIGLSKKDLYGFTLNRSIVRDMLKYSIPLLPHGLSTQIAGLISSVLISDCSNLAAMGLYSIAAKFGNLCEMIQGSVSNAYQPWLFGQLKDESDSYKEEIRKLAENLSLLYSILFIGVAFFIQELIFVLLDQSYHEAWQYIPFIIFNFCLKIPYYFYIGLLFYDKKSSKKIFIATLAGSIANALLSFVMIPIFGTYGSIYADMIAMLIRIGLVIYMANSVYGDIFSLIFFVKLNLMNLFVMFVGLYFSYTKYLLVLSQWNFMYKVSIYIVFIALIAYFKRHELKNVKKTLINIVNNKMKKTN